MPIFSGLPIPTPPPRTSTGGAKLAFLVSQQYDPETLETDNITGYITAGQFIWMVNRIFLSGDR